MNIALLVITATAVPITLILVLTLKYLGKPLSTIETLFVVTALSAGIALIAHSHC